MYIMTIVLYLASGGVQLVNSYPRAYPDKETCDVAFYTIMRNNPPPPEVVRVKHICSAHYAEI